MSAPFCRTRSARRGPANKHPKHFLFFTQSSNGQAAADAFLGRLKERTGDLDTAVSNETVQAQIAAIQAWDGGMPPHWESSASRPGRQWRSRRDGADVQFLRTGPQAAECAIEHFP